MDIWGEWEEADAQGISFWAERRGFWSTYLFSVSSFPESSNLVSGCILLEYVLKRQLLGFLGVGLVPTGSSWMGWGRLSLIWSLMAAGRLVNSLSACWLQPWKLFL